jgi:hypothetical protein
MSLAIYGRPRLALDDIVRVRGWRALWAVGGPVRRRAPERRGSRRWRWRRPRRRGFARARRGLLPSRRHQAPRLAARETHRRATAARGGAR